MLLVLQIAQYEAVAPEGQKLLLVLFWTVFRIMHSGYGFQTLGGQNLCQVWFLICQNLKFQTTNFEWI